MMDKEKNNDQTQASVDSEKKGPVGIRRDEGQYASPPQYSYGESQCAFASTPMTSVGEILAQEAWYQRMWRPAVAFVYLLIGVFDFVAMPVYIEMSNRELDVVIIERLEKFKDRDVKLAVIDKTSFGTRTWSPLTLVGGGLFHLSFGGILGAASFTRGLEKKELIKRPDPTHSKNIPWHS